MKLLKLTASSLALMAASAAFATPSETCPTLAQLGVSEITSNNAYLPLLIPSTPSCSNVPAKQNCYVTFNLEKEASAKGWNFIIESNGSSAVDALANMNQSEIFSIQGTNQPDTSEQSCKVALNGVTVEYFSPPYQGKTSNQVKSIISKVA